MGVGPKSTEYGLKNKQRGTRDREIGAMDFFHLSSVL